jgi:hypothetical protein
MKEIHELHWKDAKQILRYIQGMICYGIHYVVGFNLDLIGFSDFYWAVDGIDCDSTSRYMFSLGSDPIYW